MQLTNLSDAKVQIMYYRSYALLYVAFGLFTVSIVGFLVATAYGFTYRKIDYLYNAIFSLSVVFEIFFHFYAHKWDYISFSAFCSLFTLLLFRSPRVRAIGFGLIILAISLEAYLWDIVPARMNITIATSYNEFVGLVCVLKATHNILRRQQLLISVIAYMNVLQSILITGFFTNLVVLYPFSQCLYILISTSQLILNSVKNEREAEAARQDLEQRVAEQTRDIRSLLDNLPQGVLSVGAGGSILKDYSRVLPSLLETERIAHSPFKDLIIAPIENLSSDEKDQFLQAVLATVDAPPINFELNEDKLPNLIQYKGRFLQCTYSPILNENGLVEKINVTMLDITRQRETEQQAAREKEKLKIVAELISIKNLRPHEFFDSMRTFIVQVASKVNSPDLPHQAREIMLILHTMKGVARSYAFKKLTDSLHQAEQIYAEALTTATTLSLPRAQASLQGITQTLDLYWSVYTDTLEQLAIRTSPPPPATIKSILNAALARVPMLAIDLGKEPPNILIEGEDFPLPKDQAEALRHAFVHIVRNILDHGLETPDERQRSAKSRQGKISIQLISSADGKHVIQVQDDGRGLAVEHLKQLGQQRQLIPADADLQTQAALIFHPGISTAREVNDFSGRGMGMDAVQTFLENIGGSIRVILGEPKAGDKSRYAFQLRLEFPATPADSAENLPLSA